MIRKELESYGLHKKRAEKLRERIARLKSERERITSVLSALPSAHSSSDRLQRLTESIMLLEHNLTVELEKSVTAQIRAVELIKRLPSLKWQEICESIYIDGQTEEQTAEDYGYSDRHIRRIVRQSIEYLEFNSY